MAFSRIQTNGDDWLDKVFNADTSTPSSNDQYDLAVSDTISNNNNANNMDVVICFEGINPGAPVNSVSPQYRIFVVVEEETTPGAWSEIAESFGVLYRNFPDGPTEAKFIIQTRNTSDQGQPFNTFKGAKWFINENPSSDIRVRIFFEESDPSSAAALVSATISGTYRFY